MSSSLTEDPESECGLLVCVDICSKISRFLLGARGREALLCGCDGIKVYILRLERRFCEFESCHPYHGTNNRKL